MKIILIFVVALLPEQSLVARTRDDIGPQGLAFMLVMFIGALLICVLSSRLNKINQDMPWFFQVLTMLMAIFLTVLLLWGAFALLLLIFENVPEKWASLLS
ncbi:hypothetical protein G9F31_01495 [Acinetobacter sp. 187]|uniref:hypothetical protein n=1 Tax=Acinetobacter lanii TaxID=2715163 RepID=UPI0014092378|nr:hypothetical protein [Acinetobacter lanii]NHC02457.1 hypothetical protein [Acinetobacter lanii]